LQQPREEHFGVAAVRQAEGASELGKAIYCLFNVGLLALAVILMRRAYALFGTLGIVGYLSHLADVVFKDSLMFPFALSLIGIAVIAAGLLYHRHERAIAAWLSAQLPEAVLRLRRAQRMDANGPSATADGISSKR